MSAITIEGLTKRYQKRTAVDSLTLSLEKGNIFALLGLNGAGKSTTIRMLSCLSSPTEGEAWLMGRSITKEPQQVKKLINLSPQETAVAPKLTVAENLTFFARVYGAGREEAHQKTERMLNLFGLKERAGEKAKHLSGGLQRRLSLAMALITEPKILFLDEPTLGLDVRARRELWQIIQGLKGNMTIILTTHYLEEAEALADQIGILHRGSMKVLGTADQIKAQTHTSNLEEAFLQLTEEEE